MLKAFQTWARMTEDMDSKKDHGSGHRNSASLIGSLKRRVAIFMLHARSGERNKELSRIAAISLLLFVFVKVIGFSSPGSLKYGDANSNSNYHDGGSASSDNAVASSGISSLCGRSGDLGLGKPTTDDIEIFKKVGYYTVGKSSDSKTITKITNALQKIEHNINSGWNRTDALFIPLGQHGYVKRDITVYRSALNNYGFTTAKRPAEGMFTGDQLATEDYGAILCLSFNTDMCFAPEDFPRIPRNRRVNRLQALRDVVWSKDKFCKTINSAIRGIEEEQYTSFTFPCWVMPGDYDHLISYSKRHDIEKWIVKPRSLGAGMGIYIVDNKADITKERKTQNVIQTYMGDPHTVHKMGLEGFEADYKWDLRSYVLVTSIVPLRAYVYNRGLVRFATTPYSADIDCARNITACLTNTSLNKKVIGAKLKDITWSLYKLEKYLRTHEEDEEYEAIFLRIQKAIGLALLSAESTFWKTFESMHSGYHCQNCYHLLGVDVIFNSALEPKIVEMNGEPNLKLTSIGKTHYDVTKKSMAKDMVGIVFNRESSATSKLASRLNSWGECVTSTQSRKGVKVGKDHLEYILSTFREHSNLGGFRPVYPNRKLADTYGGFLKILHEKERTAAANSPTSKVGVHADGRRLRLHELVTAMQDDDVKYGAGQSSGSASSTKSSTLRGGSTSQSKSEDDYDDVFG